MYRYSYSENEVQDALAVVGQGMAHDYKIRVVWSEAKRVSADIHNKIVRLPRLACATTLGLKNAKTVEAVDMALNLTRSNAAHEFGHCAKTHMSAAEQPKGALFRILNSLEDVRMEREVAEDFPGYGQVFQWSNHHHNKKIASDIIDGKLKPQPLWEAMCACIFQCQGVSPAWTLQGWAKKYFDVAYPEFATVLQAKDTKECKVIAERIYELLKKLLQERKEEQEKKRKEQEKKEQEKKEQEKKEQEKKGEQQEGGEPGEGDESGEEGESKGKDDKEQKKGKGKSKDKKEASDKEEGEESSGAGDSEGDESDDEAGDEDAAGGGSDEDNEEDAADSADADTDADENKEGDKGEEGKADKNGKDEAGKDDKEYEGEGSDESDEDAEFGSGADGDEDDDSKDASESGEGKAGGGKGNSDANADDDGDGAEAGAGDADADADEEDGDEGEDGGSELTPEQKKAIEEAIEKKLEEDSEGQELSERGNDEIELALKDVEIENHGNVYTSRRDLDRHQIPAGGDDQKKQFANLFDTMQNEVAAMTLALEQALRAITRCRKEGFLRSGRLDGDRLVEIAKNLSKNIFFQRRQGRELKTAVALVIDQSGSMSNIHDIRDLVILLGECMYRLGIPFEVTGTTTMYDCGSTPELEGFARTNPIIYDHFKSFEEQWPVVRQRMVEMSSYKHNIDGEVVEYATRRLLTRTEDRKIVFSLCDGEPCGGQYNDGELGANIKRVAEMSRAAGVEVFGVGIGTKRPAKFYGEEFFVYLEKAEDKGQVFVRAFTKILTKDQVKI